MAEESKARTASTQELETVLDGLNNHFCQREKAVHGEHAIEGGALTACLLLPGQYYLIAGSVMNDGLHRQGESDLTDETFTGVIMPCAVPKAVIALAGEIAAWRADNPETDKVSESFGGYSYTRSGAGTAQGGWTAAFAARLAKWRKPYAELD